MRPGPIFRFIKVTKQSLSQDVIDQCRFSASGNARDTNQAAKWKRDCQIPQVIFAGPDNGDPTLRAWVWDSVSIVKQPLWQNSGAWYWNLQRSRKVLAGERFRVRFDFPYRTLSNDLTASRPRARAEVNDEICGTDCVLIVFNNNHRVSQVPQMLQRPDKPIVISLVKSDARFIQNVKNPCQPGTDLCAQTYALSFSSRQGAAFAIQR